MTGNRSTPIKTRKIFFLVLSFTLGFLPLSTADLQQPLVLTPTTLRQHLFESNITVLKGLNQVLYGKIKLQEARANLLPSLNLNAAIRGDVPGFFLSNITSLFSFLIPSNWFNMKASKEQFEAEKVAFHILGLNSFSSAYSSLMTFVGDRKLKLLFEFKRDNWRKLRDSAEVRVIFGLAGQEELLQADAQLSLSELQLSQLENLVDQEILALRSSLSLPSNIPLVVEDLQVPESEYESSSPEDLLEWTLKESPEFRQLHYLVEAAKYGKWSNVFGFISGASLSSQASGDQEASFGGMKPSGSVNLGFGLFSKYQLSEVALSALKLRWQEILQQRDFLIRGTLSSLQKTKFQLEKARHAESQLNLILQKQILNYNLGLSELSTILILQNDLISAASARIRAQMDMDALRISLHRIAIRGEFAHVPQCKTKQNKYGLGQSIKEFFSSEAAQKAVEEMCRKEESLD